MRRVECARRACRGLRHGVHQDALERALPKFAEQQAHEEILLVTRGPAEQLAQDLAARGGGSGARRAGELIEGGVDVADFQCGRVRRRHIAHAESSARPTPIRP